LKVLLDVCSCVACKKESAPWVDPFGALFQRDHVNSHTKGWMPTPLQHGICSL